MDNFLNFIEEDIQNKKTLLSTMPTNTKPNIRKFNEKAKSISDKYLEYRTFIKKYLVLKDKSFDIENNKDSADIINIIKQLEHIRFILNPYNTYFEKVGFDTLFYQMSNYHDFKFSSLNDITNEFIDKFDLIGINLTPLDFRYTCYVNEFMESFLSIRSLKSDNYDIVTEIFEKIYWVNPEIVNHIELNFKKLIKKHEKKFIDYVTSQQQDILARNHMTYEQCVEKLKSAYTELNSLEEENISDIINLAKTKQIDINNYFEDSKTRIATFNDLMIEALDVKNDAVMAKFCESLEKLKHNIEEYSNYMMFIPLIEYFKKEYLKEMSEGKRSDLKVIESEIDDKESKLEKLNKEIFNERVSFLDKVKNLRKKTTDLKEIKFESVKIANELYELHKTYDKEYFKDKVLNLINSTFSVSDALNLYYSFDYFKKMAIKEAFKITSYEDILEYSNLYDTFVVDPTNVIINGISLYEDSNIARVVANKYRLANINITEQDLSGDNANLFVEKIDLVLRISKIENSAITIEKIWFMSQVAKLISEDK